MCACACAFVQGAVGAGGGGWLDLDKVGGGERGSARLEFRRRARVRLDFVLRLHSAPHTKAHHNEAAHGAVARAPYGLDRRSTESQAPSVRMMWGVRASCQPHGH